MASRHNAKAIALIECDMATVARGESALGRLWEYLMVLPYRPSITVQDIDTLADEFKDAYAAIGVIRKYLSERWNQS